MNQSEFQQWKSSPITQEIFAEFREKRALYVDQLVISTGQPEALRLAGIIAAFDGLLNIQFEDIE